MASSQKLPGMKEAYTKKKKKSIETEPRMTVLTVFYKFKKVG